jgi:hypothetical protein
LRNSRKAGGGRPAPAPFVLILQKTLRNDTYESINELKGAKWNKVVVGGIKCIEKIESRDLQLGL